VRLLVTHDPIDALILADRLLILEEGRITQSGRPDDVASHPRSSYVADLAGTNLYAGRCTTGTVRTDSGVVLATGTEVDDGEVFAVIPPAAVALHRQRPEGSPRNNWPATVVEIDHLGARFRVRLTGPLPIVAEVTGAAVAELDLRPGRDIWVAVKATEITVFPA
jgi:molybdate transport system ATP-binding protein